MFGMALPTLTRHRKYFSFKQALKWPFPFVRSNCLSSTSLIEIGSQNVFGSEFSCHNIKSLVVKSQRVIWIKGNIDDTYFILFDTKHNSCKDYYVFMDAMSSYKYVTI